MVQLEVSFGVVKSLLMLSHKPVYMCQNLHQMDHHIHSSLGLQLLEILWVLSSPQFCLNFYGFCSVHEIMLHKRSLQSATSGVIQLYFQPVQIRSMFILAWLECHAVSARTYHNPGNCCINIPHNKLFEVICRGGLTLELPIIANDGIFLLQIFQASISDFPSMLLNTSSETAIH